MNVWLNQNTDGTCRVCLAGAWLISQYSPELVSKIKISLSLTELPKEVSQICCAIDSLRFGGYEHAFNVLRIPLKESQLDQIRRLEIELGHRIDYVRPVYTTDVDKVVEHLTELHQYCTKEDI